MLGGRTACASATLYQFLDATLSCSLALLPWFHLMEYTYLPFSHVESPPAESLSNLKSIVVTLILQKKKLGHRVTYLSGAPSSYMVENRPRI